MGKPYSRQALENYVSDGTGELLFYDDLENSVIRWVLRAGGNGTVDRVSTGTSPGSYRGAAFGRHFHTNTAGGSAVTGHVDRILPALALGQYKFEGIICLLALGTAASQTVRLEWDDGTTRRRIGFRITSNATTTTGALAEIAENSFDNLLSSSQVPEFLQWTKFEIDFASTATACRLNLAGTQATNVPIVTITTVAKANARISFLLSDSNDVQAQQAWDDIVIRRV